MQGQDTNSEHPECVLLCKCKCVHEDEKVQCKTFDLCRPLGRLSESAKGKPVDNTLLHKLAIRLVMTTEAWTKNRAVFSA